MMSMRRSPVSHFDKKECEKPSCREHLSLIEGSLFARRDELLKDRIVLSLERSRPRSPRSSSFRRPRLAHGSSFDMRAVSIAVCIWRSARG